MTVTTYRVRLFGGRKLEVTYDSSGGTLSILGQSLSLSSLSTALQNQWTAAVASFPVPSNGTSQQTVPAFAGDDVSQAVGAILDAAPTWRNAIVQIGDPGPMVWGL